MFLSDNELRNLEKKDLIAILADTDDLLQMDTMTPEGSESIKRYQTTIENILNNN